MVDHSFLEINVKSKIPSKYSVTVFESDKSFSESLSLNRESSRMKFLLEKLEESINQNIVEKHLMNP